MRTPFEWADAQRLDKAIPQSQEFGHKLMNLLGEIAWKRWPVVSWVALRLFLIGNAIEKLL